MKSAPAALRQRSEIWGTPKAARAGARVMRRESQFLLPVACCCRLFERAKRATFWVSSPRGPKLVKNTCCGPSRSSRKRIPRCRRAEGHLGVDRVAVADGDALGRGDALEAADSMRPYSS